MAVTTNLVIATLGAFLALISVTGWMWTLLTWSVSIIVIMTGSVLGLSLAICKGKKYSPPPSRQEPSIANLVIKKMMQCRQNFQPCQTTVVTTRGLDQAIQELMDLFIRDYILIWYQKLAADHERFPHLLQDELWGVVDRLTQRLMRVDLVHFMTKDVCDSFTMHFEEIRRTSQAQGGSHGRGPSLKLHPWLQSEAHETAFLRQVVEVCLLHLLPQPYLACTPVRQLIRELLTCSLLQPGVELICDPDYLNHKLLEWLEWREGLYHEHAQLARSTSHDDMLSVIHLCEDIDKLKQIRYNILSDLMKATTIPNLSLKAPEDIDGVSPTASTKSDIAALSSEKTIEQMKEAKSKCEKKIYTLGGPDYKSYAMLEDDKQQLPDKKVLSFQVLMDNSEARNYFLRFLHKNREDMLLRFWTAVETMKHSAQKLWHEQAGDIYQTFISQPNSVVRSHLHRATIKGMEAFMIGDTGPLAFYSAQEQIYNVLGDRHYPSFILSDMYEKYMQAEASEHESRRRISESTDGTGNKSKQKSPEKPFERFRIVAHSTYAQKKVKNLEDKIMNKSQALKALKGSQKEDQKMMKLQEEIQEDLEDLKSDRRNLESHVEKTEHWIDNVGLWTAYIYNAEIVPEEDKLVPYFAIVVHLPGAAVNHDPLMTSSRAGTSGQGWVVVHKLDDFHALHQKLVEIKPEFKKRELPTVGKFRIKSIDTEFVNKAKTVLEKYLVDVLRDDRLAQSEALFAFFSSSPEHLKQAPDPPPDSAQRPTTLQRSRFSFVNILKSLSTKTEQESDSEDELLFGDEESTKDERTRDSIAEPLYRLVGEVFELRGVFKWMRRTLMAFVQITFGRSINRQLRETVEWIFSESMVTYYLNLFRESYWPDGKLASPISPRSDEDKLKTRKLAKEKLLQNIPDALKNLVGEQNSRRGAIKIFEAMQDIRLNKQIFYVLVERLMLEIFPEILQSEKESSV